MDKARIKQEKKLTITNLDVGGKDTALGAINGLYDVKNGEEKAVIISAAAAAAATVGVVTGLCIEQLTQPGVGHERVISGHPLHVGSTQRKYVVGDGAVAAVAGKAFGANAGIAGKPGMIGGYGNKGKLLPNDGNGIGKKFAR